MPSPLRDRFGFTAHLDFYEENELEEVLRRSAALLQLEIDAKAVAEVASRSRGTPRIANRLLRRVRDYAQVHTSGKVDIDVAKKEFIETLGKISLDMDQTTFQTEVGRLEVLGELFINNK